MKPTIYITATPIGTISDISDRAIKTLQNADLIICEDTRHTKSLLNLLNIQNTRLTSLHGHNEIEKSHKLIEQILNENLENIVLVSDAGTPAISDPGSFFIKHAHKNGMHIVNIPGPSSIVCALAASGFSQPRVIFSGFLSRNTTKQKEEFEKWIQAAPCIGIFFESPKRILKTIENFNEFFIGDTQISISREISKKFEENSVTTLESAKDILQSKNEIIGEFVVCLEILSTSKKTALEKSTNFENASLKDDCKSLGKKYNINPKSIYSFIIGQTSKNKPEQ